MRNIFKIKCMVLAKTGDQFSVDVWILKQKLFIIFAKSYTDLRPEADFSFAWNISVSFRVWASDWCVEVSPPAGQNEDFVRWKKKKKKINKKRLKKKKKQ